MTEEEKQERLARDMRFVADQLKKQAAVKLAAASAGDKDEEYDEFDAILRRDGAIDRIMGYHIERLNNDPADRASLSFWLFYFGLYLDNSLPEETKQHYGKQITFLQTIISELDKGIVHPILERAVVANNHGSDARQEQCIIRCVLAADVLYNDRNKSPGKQRATREEVDKEIYNRVKSSVVKLGFKKVGKKKVGQTEDLAKTTPIPGWRSRVAGAQFGEPFYYKCRALKDVAEYLVLTCGPNSAIEILLRRIIDRQPLE